MKPPNNWANQQKKIMIECLFQNILSPFFIDQEKYSPPLHALLHASKKLRLELPPCVNAHHHLPPLLCLLRALVHRGVEALADLLHTGLEFLSLSHE